MHYTALKQAYDDSLVFFKNKKRANERSQYQSQASPAVIIKGLQKYKQSSQYSYYKIAIIIPPKDLPKTLSAKLREETGPSHELEHAFESIEYDGMSRKTAEQKKLILDEQEETREYLTQQMEEKLDIECLRLEDLLFQS